MVSSWSRCSTWPNDHSDLELESAFLISRRISARGWSGGSVPTAAFGRRVPHRRAVRAVRSRPERQLRSRRWRGGVLAAAHRRLGGLPRPMSAARIRMPQVSSDRHELAVPASLIGPAGQQPGIRRIPANLGSGPGRFDNRLFPCKMRLHPPRRYICECDFSGSRSGFCSCRLLPWPTVIAPVSTAAGSGASGSSSGVSTRRLISRFTTSRTRNPS